MRKITGWEARDNVRVISHIPDKLQQLLKPDAVMMGMQFKNILRLTKNHDNQKLLFEEDAYQESLSQQYENTQQHPMPHIVDADLDLDKVAEETAEFLRNCTQKHEIYEAFTDAFITIRNSNAKERDTALQELVNRYDEYNGNRDAFWNKLFTTSSFWWNQTVINFFEVYNLLKTLEGSPIPVEVQYVNGQTKGTETSTVHWQWFYQTYTSKYTHKPSGMLQLFALKFVDGRLSNTHLSRRHSGRPLTHARLNKPLW